jgi:ribosomal protein S6
MKTVNAEDLGALDLAYPIKKQTKGNFMRFQLEAAPEEIVKMKETFKITEGVLRYLIIKN